MNLAHELELDSQTELLERLQLLTRFGSNLVNVYGSQGAGKSWLAQRYLEEYADDTNQALVLCHPQQTDEQRRTTILSQLVSEPLFNPKDSLLDSFSALFADRDCNIAVAIDDAHLLSETLVSELWMWILECQDNPAWTINVILFVESNRLEALLTRLTYGQELKPIDLEIEHLSEEEADRLFENRVMRFIEDAMEKRVRNAYKKVQRTPGAIMALAEKKTEKRVVVRSIVGSPFNIALVVIIITLLIGAGYWWMLSQPQPGEQSGEPTQQEASSSLEQTAIPTLPTNAQSGANGVSDPMTAQPKTPRSSTTVGTHAQPQTDDSLPNDDAAALPPEVKEDMTGVGQTPQSNENRVVINSDVVDALVDDEKQPQPSNMAQAQQQAEQQQDALSQSFDAARADLNAMSPRSYTLQLAAVKSLDEVRKFLNEYQLDGQVNVYPTDRSGTTWYIVTYENYPTIQMARDAVSTLPGRLQSLGPWAKSLRQVQRELTRTK